MCQFSKICPIQASVFRGESPPNRQHCIFWRYRRWVASPCTKSSGIYQRTPFQIPVFFCFSFPLSSRTEGRSRAVGRCVYVSSKWACFPPTGLSVSVPGLHVTVYGRGVTSTTAPPPPPLPPPLLPFLSLSLNVSNLNSRQGFFLSFSSHRFFPLQNISLAVIHILFFFFLHTIASIWHESRAASIFSPSFSLYQASAWTAGWVRGNVCPGMDPVHTQEMLNCGTNWAILSEAERKGSVAFWTQRLACGDNVDPAWYRSRCVKTDAITTTYNTL